MKFKILIITVALLSISVLNYAEEGIIDPQVGFEEIGIYEEKDIILSQEDVPIQILSYTAEFEKGFRGKGEHPDQIRHTVRYKNVSGERIVAIRLGIGAFNIFNEFMDKFAGYVISELDIDQQDGSIWDHRPYAVFTFRNFGTGFVYVDAIRFEDGTIWHADLEEILQELRKFEISLEKKDLEEKRE